MKTTTRLSLIITLLLRIGFAANSQTAPLPTDLPPHPRILFNAQDIPSIKERIASETLAKGRFDTLKREADGWLNREVTLPDRGGQWYHYYSCPKHGARLRTEAPNRHVCPIDGEVLSGYPYDDVALMSEHNRFAGAVRTLGIVHQLTGDVRYAAKAKEIILAYAAKYASYPLHNIRGEDKIGGGKVSPQTLDESTWLITIIEGADCIWNTLKTEEQNTVANDLLYPATQIIRQHKMGIHNIQCWKNSAVGLAGLLMGDRTLLDEALNADSGYFNQMAKGTTPDGAWFEGAWGYHFYTMSAVTHLTEGAFHCGIDLYGNELKGMFDAPLALAMPNWQLPAFNDSHEVSILGSASLYETALARYRDVQYQSVLRRNRRESDAALFHGVPELEPESDSRSASRNFPDSGFAILSSGNGLETTWLCLDYGPHGGGHGHPDKLGFVLYGLGTILAPDPGTANYGVPIQSGWYRTTIAHNTLTVDATSQRAATGACEAFVSADSFSAVMADAGNIYDGVSFRRTIALVGTDLLVFVDQIRADREHTFDLAYHNRGECSVPPGAESFELSETPGYAYLRDTKVLDSKTGLSLEFTAEKNRNVQWVMGDGEPTSYIVGTGVGAHTEDRVPLVIARRKAKETTYIWVLALGSLTNRIELTREDVAISGGSPEETSEVAAARVTVGSQVNVVIANPRKKKVIVAGDSTQSKITWLSGNANTKLALRRISE